MSTHTFNYLTMFLLA